MRRRKDFTWVGVMARLAVVPLALPPLAAKRLLDGLIPVVVSEVVRRVDLTELIIRQVDLDRVMAEVDLAGLVEAADLPEIIRESTGSMVSGSVRQIRFGGIAADDAVGRARTRLLRSRPR